MGKACPSFELLSAYRDGETTPAETALVARHLPGCPECRATVGGFEQLAAALAAAPAIPCGVALPLLSAQLDGEATAPELALLAGHLAGCASCTARRAAWTSLNTALAALPEAFPSPAADAKMRALAIHTHAPRPNVGRALASLAVIASTVALAVFNTLSGGFAPRLGASPQGGQTAIVASAAQQLYNPSTGLLYVLHPAPASAVVVRDVARQSDVKTILLGGAPAFMAMNAKVQSLYVVDPAARTYTDIDTQSNEIRARVPLDVSGTPTSIAVDADTGKLVVATEPAKTPVGVAAPAATARPQIAIIDPSSRTLEVVKQVDVSPTRIVVDAVRGRLFLLAATGTSVLDARTYQTIDALPSAAVAVAAGPERTALLAERSGDAVLTFYQAAGSGLFHGHPTGLFALADGGFVVLVDDGTATRILLANADGSDRGTSLAVTAGTRGLTFDAATGRFLDASGTAVAAVSAGVLVAVTPSTAPSVATAPATAPTTVAPQPPAASTATTPAVNAPATATPLVVLPTPSPAPSLFPGAVLSAGLYRYELGANYTITAMTTGDDGRIWFAASDGALRTIAPKTGQVTVAVQLGGVHVTRLASGAGRVFALTDSGRLFVFRTTDAVLSGAQVPFGAMVTAVSVSPGGQLWMVSPLYNGLLSFDAVTAQLSIVFLDAGTSPTAVSVDGAGRVWFADATWHQLGVYEPSLGKVSYRALPTADRVVAMLADASSSVWLGTDHGAVLRLQSATISTVVASGPAVVALVPDRATAAVLVDAGQSTLAGVPGESLTVASGTARSLAVDLSGQIWIADGQRAVLYIAGLP